MAVPASLLYHRSAPELLKCARAPGRKRQHANWLLSNADDARKEAAQAILRCQRSPVLQQM
jgi:hypothetical protein